MAKDMQSKTKQTTKRNRITFPDAQGDQREIYLSAKYDDSVVENFRSVVNALVRVRDYGGYLTSGVSTLLLLFVSLFLRVSDGIRGAYRLA